MIQWSECNVEWVSATEIGKITHLPTGTVIQANLECDGSEDAHGIIARDEYLKWLDAEVEAAQT